MFVLPLYLYLIIFCNNGRYCKTFNRKELCFLCFFFFILINELWKKYISKNCLRNNIGLRGVYRLFNTGLEFWCARIDHEGLRPESLRCLRIGAVLSNYLLTDMDLICGVSVCVRDIISVLYEKKTLYELKIKIKMLYIVALKCFVNYTIEGENISAHIQVVPNRCLLAV
jgi:hypothetical protein